MTSFKKQTVSSVKWLIGSSFLQKAIQLCGTIVLARILGPTDFGLFALAFVAIDALGLFRSMGFDTALVRRKDDIEKAANTAFFIIPVLGITLYFVLSLFAPLIAKFLNNQQLVSVIRALGITFVIGCLGKVPAALLEKNMQFRRVAIIEVGTAVIYSSSAVIFALLKFGVWSLVVAYILKTLYQNILTFIYAKWHPRFEFDKKIALEMFHFGKFIFLGSIVWFIKSNLDNLVVGKLLGTRALGIYAVAFNIAYFGLSYFGDKISRVIFPVFSKIHEDKVRLKNSFFKVTKLITIIALPLYIVLIIFANQLISLIYGNKWLEAIPVLKILSIAGFVNLVPTAMGPLYYSTGHSKPAYWFTFLQVVAFFALLPIIAKTKGLIGVAFVVLLSQALALLIFTPFTLRIINANTKDLFLSLRPVFLIGLTLAVFYGSVKLFLINLNFFHIIPMSYILSAILCLAFLISYVLCLRIFENKAFNEIKGIIINKHISYE